MKLIDTHTHLYLPEFSVDIAHLIQKAFTNEVHGFLLPNIEARTLLDMKTLVQKYPLHCFPMMGLHPCSVGEAYQVELDLVETELQSGAYIGVGEIGLDLHWDKTFFKQQQDAFRIQCTWAASLDLAVSMHTREAFEEAYAILSDLPKRPQGVFHCFGGTLEQAQRAIDMGFLLGIGGVVTFKNAGLDKLLEQISLEHLVLETDAPYLAPIPHRGKRNEPEYLRLIAEKIAQIKNCTLEHVANVTTSNAARVFKLKL